MYIFWYANKAKRIFRAISKGFEVYIFIASLVEELVKSFP